MITPIPGELIATLLGGSGIGVAIFDVDDRFHYVNERMAAFNGVPAEDHVGRSIAEVLPEMAGVVSKLVGRARSGEAVVGSTFAGSTSGVGLRQWEASYLPIALDDGPGTAVIVMDVTERYEAVVTSRRRLRQQTALADLGQLALRETDLAAVMDEATTRVAAELSAERAGVLVFTPAREELVMLAGSGFPPGLVGRMTAAYGAESQAGYTLMADGPVITADTHLEERFVYTRGLLDLGVRSAISVPIPGGDEPFGVLGALASVPDHFDEDDAAFVRAAANVLGAAVARAEQARELEALAAQRGRLVAQALDAGDRERRQVADILHDEVLQHLLFARLELAGLEGEQKDRVQASMEEASTLLRRVIGGLHPVTLAHAGLSIALEGMAAEHAARAGIVADVDVDPGAEGVQDRLVLSLARELLTNVVKHSGATRATLRVISAGAELRLEVADDGCGLDADAFETALARGNVGLATARERVMALGGTVVVATGLDDRGTRIAITLPSG